MSTRRPKQLRIGKFSISQCIIDEKPAMARILMRDIIIVRAELDYRTAAIDYIGICEKFDLVNELDPTPSYTIEKQGFSGRKITRVGPDGLAVTQHLEVDVDDDDDDEDEEEVPRKRGRPLPKTGRVSSHAATFEEVEREHPVAAAVNKVAGKKPEPTDHMLITREFIEGSR